MESSLKTRILLTFLGSLVVLLVLVARLFQLQIPADAFPARNPHLKRVVLHRERGAILDRNGNRLAFSIPAMGVQCDTRQIPDPERVAELLGPLLGIVPEELAKRLGSGRGYELLAHKVDPEVADQIRKLRIPGLGFEQEYRRFYPNGSMASTLLGFVGSDGHGLEGIEHRYEDVLAAVPGEKVVLQGLRGFELPGGVLRVDPPKGAADVYLTIDEIIQHLAEKELDNIERSYRPKSASLLVMDPNTGEILAWAGRPGFDPNSYQAYPKWSWRNRMITDIFEPGSTFKIITAAAALEDKVLELGTRFECPGYAKLWGHVIGCTGNHGEVALPDIIAKSCNTGIIKIGHVLGPQDLYYYTRKFGFGQETGLPLPGETAGILRVPEKWSGMSIGAISMGQEVGVTAVQMASAISAIANGGLLIEPRIVSKILDRDGNRVDKGPDVVVKHRVIERGTAETITRLMSEVVVRGTGRRGRVDTWQAAGKTGTSQKLGMRTAAGESEKFVASFVGFLPVRSPRILIYIVINEPTGEGFRGGEIAAPSFSTLAPKIMIYRDIPPDTEPLPALDAPDVPQTAARTELPPPRFAEDPPALALPGGRAPPRGPDGSDRAAVPVGLDVLYIADDAVQDVLSSQRVAAGAAPAAAPVPARPGEVGGEPPPPPAARPAGSGAGAPMPAPEEGEL